LNKIALSFDIEDWYHGAPISGASISKYRSLDDFLKQHPGKVSDCITEETFTILDILDKLHIRATFFVVADVAMRYPKIIERLRSSNHEIASHSMTHHSAIDSGTKQMLRSNEEWIQDQQLAKKTLEDIFSREITGFRAPNAYFATWMVKPLSEIGFKYDSSIAFNSFYNKTDVVLRDVPTYPYRLNSQTLGCKDPDTDLVEIPWSYYKFFNLYFPAGGAYFFRFGGYRYFRMVMKQALEKGDTMFYLHPLDITAKQIPEKNAKSRPFFWINKGKKAQRDLVKFLTKYQDLFGTCHDIAHRLKGSPE
jgi:peptidoglycan/xylan/chitin deacetylase (PgdA/CDA1 family)